MEKAGSAVMEKIDELVERHHLLKHSFYLDWQAGSLTRERLQLYAAQYYRHVEAFPDQLRTLAARAGSTLRPVVEENLAEEENPDRPHPRLWRDFAAAVGTSPEQMNQPALPGTQALVETYGRICREQPVEEAVAALYVYEAQVPEIASQKIKGLRTFYGVSDPKGLAYFAVHEEADVRHRAAWREWLAANASENSADILATAEAALRALWTGLDAVQEEKV